MMKMRHFYHFVMRVYSALRVSNLILKANFCDIVFLMRKLNRSCRRYSERSTLCLTN